MGQCYNSIVVHSPVDAVWNRIRNFHDMSWCLNVVPSVEPIGEKRGTEVGARRKLDGAFLETLIELNDEKRRFRYTIDDGPGALAADAVESYVSTVQLFPVTATGETFVLWISEYKTKDDGAVGVFCNPIYHAILGDLAKNM